MPKVMQNTFTFHWPEPNTWPTKLQGFVENVWEQIENLVSTSLSASSSQLILTTILCGRCWKMQDWDSKIIVLYRGTATRTYYLHPLGTSKFIHLPKCIDSHQKKNSHFTSIVWFWIQLMTSVSQSSLRRRRKKNLNLSLFICDWSRLL